MIRRQRVSYKFASGGFTLTEVLIVIVLLGIVGVFAVPRLYDNFTKNKISGAARIIMTDIRYAQELSMSSAENTWVVFDDSANQYRIYKGPSSSNWGLVTTHILDGSSYRQLNAGVLKDVNITSLDLGIAKTIGFDSGGNSSNSVQGSIVLNNSVTITIQPYTGLVQIAE